MSPSIYLGCAIQDDIGDALSQVNQVFKSVEEEGKAVIATLASSVEQLTGTKKYAEATIGSTTNNQVVWKAKKAGIDGNSIQITYVYKGPDFFGGAYQDRPPSAEANESTVFVTLAVDANGAIDPSWDTAASLAVWMTGTGVADLVTISLVGSGADLPEITELTLLTGGEGAPLKDAETAADGIAKQLGRGSYTDLLKSLDIPVVQSAADAASYLESQDDEIVIINKKLFFVEGTNLVGIRQLYSVLEKDLKKLKEFLAKINSTLGSPNLFLTENLETIIYEEVCGEIRPLTVTTEVYRTYNEPPQTTATRFTDGDVTRLNGYIFWGVESSSTIHSYNKLTMWGYSDDLITDILAGETPVVENYYGQLIIPVVEVIDDPTLLSVLKLTDSEIVELLEKDVPGIKVPAADDPEKKAKKLAELTKNDREVLPNGMRTKIKKPIAVQQAVDLSKTGGDKNLAKELATRGRACARQEKNMTNSLTRAFDSAAIQASTGLSATQVSDAVGNLANIPNYSSPNLSSLNIPNIPSPDLPNMAKKVESAFGALSSVISTASQLFDRLIGGMMKVVNGALNSIQNLMSMTENLLNNSLVKCLLGTASAVTGKPDLPALGGGPAIPNPDSMSIGGIPIPMGLLKAALTELSATLDKTITEAFAAMMKIIEKPLCMVKSLLDDILGFDLGAELNPCKDAKDPDAECPAEDGQGVINESSELTSVYDSLPQSDLFPKEPSTEKINETVEEFTGTLKKTTEEITQEITRGVTQVMEDITKVIESKVDTLTKFDKAIRKLLGEDVTDAASTIAEESLTQEGCAPPAIGVLTDAISNFI